ISSLARPQILMVRSIAGGFRMKARASPMSWRFSPNAGRAARLQAEYASYHAVEGRRQDRRLDRSGLALTLKLAPELRRGGAFGTRRTPPSRLPEPGGGAANDDAEHEGGEEENEERRGQRPGRRWRAERIER